MTKITVTFDIGAGDFAAPNFGEGTDEKTSLHEALCQTIHENNDEALDWLNDHVSDIKLTEDIQQD